MAVASGLEAEPRVAYVDGAPRADGAAPAGRAMAGTRATGLLPKERSPMPPRPCAAPELELPAAPLAPSTVSAADSALGVSLRACANSRFERSPRERAEPKCCADRTGDEVVATRRASSESSDSQSTCANELCIK